jgi:hypothetical protein
LGSFSLDVIREGDREKVLELQRKAGCDFPVPDPLVGFVVRDGERLVAWAGWEKVAEVLGMVDVDLSAKEKVRIWASLHKPIESEIIRKGITVAYCQVKQDHHRFAGILSLLGWVLTPGFWLRREAGKGLNLSE